MAIALELCEGICGVMWCLCTSKKTLSSFTWTLLVIVNPYMAMVFNLHELYHESCTFWIIRLHFCNGWLLDKYDSFYFFQQNNNWWKYIQVICLSCLLVSWLSWRHHLFFYHEPQFAAKFWKTFFELLSVKVKLLLAFHPWMDGQIEWVNQNLE
jgi:hypothetical protein